MARSEQLCPSVVGNGKDLKQQIEKAKTYIWTYLKKSVNGYLYDG